MSELRLAIEWHLAWNHYPPAPAWLLEPAVEAVEAARVGAWEREVSHPAHPEAVATAADLIEALRLEDMIEGGDDE